MEIKAYANKSTCNGILIRTFSANNLDKICTLSSSFYFSSYLTEQSNLIISSILEGYIIIHWIAQQVCCHWGT